MSDDSRTAGPQDEIRVEHGGRPKFGIVPDGVQRLPAPLAHTYLALAVYADSTRRCWPSLTRLADDMGINRATLARRLIGLEEAGYIAREAGGGSYATRYTLLGWGSRADATGGSRADATPVVAPTRPEQTREQTMSTETPPTPPSRRTPARNNGEDPQAVLASFNAAFGTNYSGEAWLKRIERRWPEGWTLDDWQGAIIALERGNRFWERDGGRPHPGHLIGRDGTWLLALREQANDVVRDELARRRGRALREDAYREIDERRTR